MKEGPQMSSSSPGLDFQTAALAAGLVSGLTFLIGQARSYLDRAVSEAQESAKQQDDDLQKARKGNEIYLAGRATLTRYAAVLSLGHLLAQTVWGLVRRPLPVDDEIIGTSASSSVRSINAASIRRYLNKRSRRALAHPSNEPRGIAMSLLILLVAMVFSLALVIVLVALIVSAGWNNLSAHSSITGSVLIVIIAFTGALGFIAWLTARDALFDLTVVSGSESIKLARTLELAENKWQIYRFSSDLQDTKGAREARRQASDACKEALRIYSRTGQALHLQGALRALDAAEMKRLTIVEGQPLLEGIACLTALPEHLAPVISRDIPHPRLILGWLFQETLDNSGAADALAAFLLSGQPDCPELPETAINPHLWLDACQKIEGTQPALLSTDIFLACEKRLRQSPKVWAELASKFAKRGNVSREIVRKAAQDIQRIYPDDEHVRTLIEGISKP
jgi:hypothetical protein